MARPRPEAPVAATRGHAFLRSDRMRKRADFLRVQGTGRRVHTPHFVIMVAPAEGQRIGITVTKRIASAVGRNRIKRLLREAFRRHRELFPEHADIVVVARKGAAGLDYATVLDELRALEGLGKGTGAAR